MSKRQLLMIIGIFVIVFLHLGIGPGLDKILALLVGLLIIAIAYSMRPQNKEIKEMPFVEHKTEANVNTVYPAGYNRPESAGAITNDDNTRS